MLVGICCTKSQPDTNKIYKSFRIGIENFGDDVIFMKDINEKKIEECDVTIQCSEYNKYGAYKKFNKFRKILKDKSKRRIIVDTGFIRNIRSRLGHNGYYAVGFDGIKGLGNYYNNDSPRDRWDKLGIRLFDWHDGKDILIVGQTLNGVSTNNINIMQYLDKTIKKVKKITNRNIIFKRHPNDHRHLPKNVQIVNKTLKQICTGAKVCITYSSNASIDSILYGCPVITLGEINMLYKYTDNDILEDMIENPKTFNRIPVLSDLCYAQWNLKEMESGETWERLRKHV